MCGRYTLRANLNQLHLMYGTESEVEWEPRYNIAPTQNVVAVRSQPTPTTSRPDKRELVLLRWGLIPSWADDPKIGNRLINARSETLAEKNSFKVAFKRRRCLVIADGFYEWHKEGQRKQPYFIHRKDERPFAFAGLWEQWKKSESPIESCTIITTSPNELMSQLHDRMPVILTEEAINLWLDPDIDDPKALLPLLTPYPTDDLTAYPVSTLVNSPKHETSECAKAIEPFSNI